MDNAELASRFKSHPATPERAEVHEAVRQQCAVLAGLLSVSVPEGREKALAMTKVEEAMFWANAGIARGGGA